MGDNAELYSRCDEKSIRITLINYLRSHKVDYSQDMTNEELRQLYINKEIGKI